MNAILGFVRLVVMLAVFAVFVLTGGGVNAQSFPAAEAPEALEGEPVSSVRSVFYYNAREKLNHLEDRLRFLKDRPVPAGSDLNRTREALEDVSAGLTASRRLLESLDGEDADGERLKELHGAVQTARQDLHRAAGMLLPEKQAFEWEVESRLLDAREKIDLLKAEAAEAKGVSAQQLRDRISQLENEIQKVRTGLKLVKAEEGDGWRNYRTDLERELEELGSHLK